MKDEIKQGSSKGIQKSLGGFTLPFSGYPASSFFPEGLKF